MFTVCSKCGVRQKKKFLKFLPKQKFHSSFFLRPECTLGEDLRHDANISRKQSSSVILPVTSEVSLALLPLLPQPKVLRNFLVLHILNTALEVSHQQCCS